MNDFEYFVSTLPDNQKSSEKYNVRRYWELNGKPKDFKEAVNLGMYTLGEDGYYHANSVSYNQENNTYEFMKDPSHDTLWMEVDAYTNSPDMHNFRNDYILDYNTMRYIPRQKEHAGLYYLGLPPSSVPFNLYKQEMNEAPLNINYLNLFK